MTDLDHLNSRIAERTAVIGVIGLGYVGLPLVFRFAEAGFGVVGFDIDPDKVDQPNAGRSYIRHLDEDLVQHALRHEFEATTEAARAAEVDALLIFACRHR